ncbi:unnamed protein product, partial [Choristocarpus tenellus]
MGGDDQIVKVLDLFDSCTTVASGQAHSESLTSLQWTLDERQLISAAKDCTIAVWNFY